MNKISISQKQTCYLQKKQAALGVLWSINWLLILWSGCQTYRCMWIYLNWMNDDQCDFQLWTISYQLSVDWDYLVFCDMCSYCNWLSHCATKQRWRSKSQFETWNKCLASLSPKQNSALLSICRSKASHHNMWHPLLVMYAKKTLFMAEINYMDYMRWGHGICFFVSSAFFSQNGFFVFAWVICPRWFLMVS